MPNFTGDLLTAFIRLSETQKRILQYGVPAPQADFTADMTEDQLKLMYLVMDIKEYADSLFFNITRHTPEEEQAQAVATLDVLIVSIESLFTIHIIKDEERNAVREEMATRAQHARSHIRRKPKSFNDEIIRRVYNIYTEKNGIWQGKISVLGRKLKPEIDRLAIAGGGKELETDTINRRLKALQAE